jgi:hypothetical protein
MACLSVTVECIEGNEVSDSAMVDPEGRLFPPNNEQSPASTLQIIGRGDTIVSSGTFSLMS